MIRAFLYLVSMAWLASVLAYALVGDGNRDGKLLDQFEEAAFEACMGDYLAALQAKTVEYGEYEAGVTCSVQSGRAREVLAMVLRSR